MLRITVPVWHLLCCTFPAHLGIWTTILFLVLEEHTVMWASPQFLQRPLQHQLKCLVCLSVLENPFLLPFFPQAGHWWSLLFSLSTDSLAVLLIFWAYQCILFLTLTLHFRGQALFYFLSHKCRLNFQNFSGQNNVKTCKLHFRLPPLLGCVVNWNEQSWQCLRTFLFWLQNKASCALYTVFSLINTWNNLLAITLYFSSFFKDVCYITCFGLEVLSISTAFSGDCNVFWFLY